MNKMKLVLGDWSDDGHGKYKEHIFEVNHTVEEVQQAYKDSCKLVGVQFSHNEDYTEGQLGNKFRGPYQICTEYEDSSVKIEAYERLIASGIPKDLFDEVESDDKEVYLDCFEDLWWEFVKLSLPDLVYKEIKNDIPPINGWWNKNLNVQFGYGLF